jgi:murein biosynthesis integral membrane protein MurJ
MFLPERLSSTGRLVAVQLRAANRHILRALFSLVSAALLLRIGGMVNQVVVSANFGAGGAMDAYFVAGTFPLLLVQLISSAIEAGVIPIYSQVRLRTDKEEVSRLFSTLLNSLILISVLLISLLLVFRWLFVLISAPGLDAARLSQAVALTPLLYLVVPLSLVIGLLECILNAEGHFGWPAYAGLLVPLTTALLTCLGGKTYGVLVLCVGTLLGTVLQLVVVCFRARQARLRYLLVLDLRDTHFRAILHISWPVLIGALISQGSPLVDQIFASMLPVGSIAALSYALKLVSIYSGVIFVSVGRAVLPYLARQAALRDPRYRAFKETLRLYLWSIALCVLVLSFFLWILAHPLVEVLFQREAFSMSDTQKTVKILLGFVLGLTPMALSFLLSRAFSALGETRIPMYIAFVSVGANALFDALFAHFWQGLGIALATSVVYLISCVLLLILLHRRIGNLYLYRLPNEFREGFAWLKRKNSGLGERLSQGLLLAGVTLLVLTLGVIATVRDALITLRVSVGMLVALCFLRYPFFLLLTWASINVCFGSSLALFNGNNLDMVLTFPLLLLLGFLPWKRILRLLPGLIWLGLYVGWVLIGMKLSPLDTRAFLTLWLTMLAYLAVSSLTIALVTTPGRLLRLIDTLLVTGVCAALYGLYGFVTHQGGEIDPETLFFRITGFFTQATTFAFYLSLLIPLAFYRCLSLSSVKKLVGVVVMLCLLVALLLTFTRSAYISAFASVLLMAFCLPAYWRIRVVSMLAALCGLAIFLGWSGNLPLLARFFQSDVTTFNGRIYLWQALVSRFQLTQWFGNGLQASDKLLTYLRVGNLGQGVIGTAPHSLFLGTLYDHGVIGLGLLLGVFLSLGYSLLRGMCRSDGERRILYAVALAALVSMLLQSLTSRDIWVQAVGIPFWITVALPFAFVWSQPRAIPTEQPDVRENTEETTRPLEEVLAASYYLSK